MVKIREGGGSNVASNEEASTFVEEMDRIEQDRENRLHQIDVEFKAKKLAVNQSANAEIKAQLEDAKKVGLAKGTLKLIVSENKGLRKAQETLDRKAEVAKDRIDALEGTERERAVNIIKALGVDFAGFGLGAAAVEREDGNGKAKEPDAAGIAAAMAADDAKKAGKGAAKH